MIDVNGETYKTGDQVLYEGKVYICVASIPPGVKLKKMSSNEYINHINPAAVQKWNGNVTPVAVSGVLSSVGVAAEVAEDEEEVEVESE